MVEHEVDAGARHEGGEAADELVRGEVEVGGAVTPRMPQLDPDPAAVEQLEVVLGDGGAAQVAALC